MSQHVLLYLYRMGVWCSGYAECLSRWSCGFVSCSDFQALNTHLSSPPTRTDLVLWGVSATER